MERKAYFAALRLHSPAAHKACKQVWERDNKEKTRKQTRLRVARFRARKG